MKNYLLVLSLFFTVSAFAYESLDLVQKNCQTPKLSETTSSHYYMGSVVFNCDNKTSVKFDYQNKLVKGSVSLGKIKDIIESEEELKLIHQQLILFYKESDEYKLKKQYEYKLPIKDGVTVRWHK